MNIVEIKQQLGNALSMLKSIQAQLDSGETEKQELNKSDYSLDDLRAKALLVKKDQGIDTLRELLSAFNATKLSDIDVDDYEQFLESCDELIK